MKKWIYTGFLILPLLLGGCAAYQYDYQTLKIKVINLETTVNKLQAEINKQNKKISEIEERLNNLKINFSKNIILDIKTQILSDIEEIKSRQAQLASQIEEMQFSQEERNKEIKSEFENLNTKLMALDLRLKTIENKLNLAPAEKSNATANTTINNGTLISSQKVSNKTSESISNAIINKSFNKTSPIVSNQTKVNNMTSLNNAILNNVTKAITYNATNNAINNATTNATNNATQSIKKPLTEADLFEKAYTYYKNRNFDKAIETFKEYLKKFPDGRWIGQAYYWIGESYFNQKKYEEAILNYQKLIDLPNFHPLKPAAMYKQALAFKALGDKEAFSILIKKLIVSYPHSKEAQKAKKLLNSEF